MMTVINFNPRTHKECDLTVFLTTPTIPLFQSTHSQRVRRDTADHFWGNYTISIHALTKSATADAVYDQTQQQISIHALTKSAT